MARSRNFAIGLVLAASLITACEPAPLVTPLQSATNSASMRSAPGHTEPVRVVGQVIGTVVRFSSGSSSVEVRVDQDNPAVRDFLSMLPLTLKLEEFAGREKIGYLPRKLDVSRAPGSDPQDGDLIYYVPWGNVGFYYDASGIGYSDKTIHLGTYKASPDQLKQFEGRHVTVEVAR